MPLTVGDIRRLTKKAKRATRKAKAVKALAPKARKVVAKIAKRVMNRKVETKFLFNNPERNYDAIYGDSVPSYSTTPLAQLYTCLPQITQGDDAEDRVGNHINPVRHTTDLRFVFNEDALITTATGNVPAAQAGWDITVHIWYGYARRYKTVDDANTNGVFICANAFEDGAGNPVRWSGRLLDETFVLNRDFVQMKHKKFRMYKNAGLANALDVVAPSLSTPMAESKRVQLVWKAPKVLRYPADSSLIPENYAPIMIVGYCHNDATQASNTLNAAPTSNILQIPAVKMLKVDKLYFKDP